MTTFPIRITMQDGEITVDEDGQLTLRALAAVVPTQAPEPPQDAVEHLARERAAPPEPFTPAQRAWIQNRIEAAIAIALAGGEESPPDRLWPEGGGEIDF